MRETHVEHDTHAGAQDGAYNLEDWLAWLLAATAIVIGVLGLLTAFQIVELRDYESSAGVQTPAGEGDADTDVTTGGGQGEAEVGGVGVQANTVSSESFGDGVLLITTGIAAALLALCLHSNDHHRARRTNLETDRSEAGLWNGEHALSYLFALVTIALGTTAVLTGFDAFGADTNAADGIIWSLCAIGAGVITTTLHSVRHHQTVAEEDYLVRMVEDRAGVNTVSGPGVAAERTTPQQRR